MGFLIGTAVMIISATRLPTWSQAIVSEVIRHVGFDKMDRGWPGSTYAATMGGANPREVSMDAYCMKCRTKREIQSPSQITLKNGRPAAQGTCAVCGTKLFRIGKS